MHEDIGNISWIVGEHAWRTVCSCIDSGNNSFSHNKCNFQEKIRISNSTRRSVCFICSRVVWTWVSSSLQRLKTFDWFQIEQIWHSIIFAWVYVPIGFGDAQTKCPICQFGREAQTKEKSSRSGTFWSNSRDSQSWVAFCSRSWGRDCNEIVGQCFVFLLKLSAQTSFWLTKCQIYSHRGSFGSECICERKTRTWNQSCNWESNESFETIGWLSVLFSPQNHFKSFLLLSKLCTTSFTTKMKATSQKDWKSELLLLMNWSSHFLQISSNFKDGWKTMRHDPVQNWPQKKFNSESVWWVVMRWMVFLFVLNGKKKKMRWISFWTCSHQVGSWVTRRWFNWSKNCCCQCDDNIECFTIQFRWNGFEWCEDCWQLTWFWKTLECEFLWCWSESCQFPSGISCWSKFYKSNHGSN